MLSNDNDVADDTLSIEVVKEAITTPVVKQATTPVAFPKPLAQSRSDDHASHGTETLTMAKFAKMSKTSQIHDEHEESK